MILMHWILLCYQEIQICLSFFPFFEQNEVVIPAFPDLHLSPAAILKELSTYFPKFSSQTRLLTLPAPHELPPRDAQEYPSTCYISWLISWYWYVIIELIFISFTSVIHAQILLVTIFTANRWIVMVSYTLG